MTARSSSRSAGPTVLTEGGDATILALAAMVPRAVEAAGRLAAEHGIGCSVVDVRSLVPLDTRTILAEVAKTGRLFTVEENPRLCGWGAEIVSIAAEEAFGALRGPAGADHHAAHPAARRRRARGPRAALGGADHRRRCARHWRTRDRLTLPPSPASRCRPGCSSAANGARPAAGPSASPTRPPRTPWWRSPTARPRTPSPRSPPRTRRCPAGRPPRPGSARSACAGPGR